MKFWSTLFLSGMEEVPQLAIASHPVMLATSRREINAPPVSQASSHLKASRAYRSIYSERGARCRLSDLKAHFCQDCCPLLAPETGRGDSG